MNKIDKLIIESWFSVHYHKGKRAGSTTNVACAVYVIIIILHKGSSAEPKPAFFFLWLGMEKTIYLLFSTGLLFGFLGSGAFATGLNFVYVKHSAELLPVAGHWPLFPLSQRLTS